MTLSFNAQNDKDSLAGQILAQYAKLTGVTRTSLASEVPNGVNGLVNLVESAPLFVIQMGGDPMWEGLFPAHFFATSGLVPLNINCQRWYAVLAQTDRSRLRICLIVWLIRWRNINIKIVENLAEVLLTIWGVTHDAACPMCRQMNTVKNIVGSIHNESTKKPRRLV
jgi:hypothetical protein